MRFGVDREGCVSQPAGIREREDAAERFINVEGEEAVAR